MKTITKGEALSLILKSNGKVFSAVFTKKDGSDRHINCRLGVSKGVTGKGLKFDPKQYNLLNVYDMQSKGHKFINIETLRSVQIEKTVYVICEAA